jgi:hypothetical protein
MAQQWRISIKGKQRQDPDIDLLIQAVIALGHQLRKEEQAQSSDSDSSAEATDKPEGGSA